MARREDVEALEALSPWDDAVFQAGMASLTLSVGDAARAFARDACTLAALAAQVPRCAQDEVGGTPWTSFRQQLAVARKTSTAAAAAELRIALRLTTVLPRTLELLEAGVLTVARAKVFVTELEAVDDDVAEHLDAELAERVVGLAPWRITDEVRRAVLALDPDAAAVRAAAATSRRDVTLEPLQDGQACVTIVGPAVPLVRWHATLDARARALRQAGDPRNLAALRFDLAASTFPCPAHAPADAGAGTTPDVPADRSDGAAAGLRLSGVEAASTDCRISRPVQAVVLVPVETALGLSNEPGWLDGYGWLDAPTSRLLLPDAQLRQLSIDGTTGQVVDLAARDVRPPPTPTGVRDALLAMTTQPTPMTDTAWRIEAEHDPSDPLRALTALRDRWCDGPTQQRTRASLCDLDHDRPFPHGPTAAWNLVSRSRRAHQLKHAGWTGVRTATGTTWTSPTGVVVRVPAHRRAAPGTDHDSDGAPPALPDPDRLHTVDSDQLTPVTEQHPVLPPQHADVDDPPPW